MERCGYPNNFCSAIHKMYQYLIVLLNIENIIEEIIQEIGVRQGDNISPVLFIFLMTNFSESLEDIWEDNVLKNRNSTSV